jgi:hypothetical protein
VQLGWDEIRNGRITDHQDLIETLEMRAPPHTNAAIYHDQRAHRARSADADVMAVVSMKELEEKLICLY